MQLRLLAAATVLVVVPAVVLDRIDAHAGAAAEQDIRRLLRVWDEACERHEVQALARVLANNFTMTDASGAVLTRVQYLTSLVRTPDVARVASCASQDVVITITGDTAIVTGRSMVKGRPRGRSQALGTAYRFSDTWTRSRGTWKVVATKAVTATTH